jgi:hypothetical protein
MTDDPFDLFDWPDPTMRRDGLTVTQGESGGWHILPRDARPVISQCPCCDKPLPTARAARLVADHVYPIK